MALEPETESRTRTSAANLSEFGDAMVTINVGKDKKTRTFTIHRAKLLKSSKYFRDALQTTFGAEIASMHLQDANEDTFELYQDWLYARTIASEPAERPQKYENQVKERDDLYECCVLAHRVEDMAFLNAAVDTFIEAILAHTWEPTHLAKNTCANLPTGDPLRKLIVDIWAYSVCPNDYDSKDTLTDREEAPDEFWEAVDEETLVRNRTPENGEHYCPWEHFDERCRYHVHREGVPECK